MVISGIGVDIEEVASFKESCKERRFIELLFTNREAVYCKKKREPFIHLAGKFCAKEAVMKAYAGTVAIKDIEVVNSPSGRVLIYVKGKKKANIHCSISHTEKYAVAFVLMER